MKRAYLTLISNIRNWPRYFVRKATRELPGSRTVTHTFVTRRRGISFRVPDPLMGVFKEMFMHDLYTLEAIVSELNEGAVVVDVGANVGLFSLALLDRIPLSRLLAVEPFPRNFEILRANLQPNESESCRIELISGAVIGEETGETTLYYDDQKPFTIVASVVTGFAASANASVTVPALTLPSLIANHELVGIDLLKMDCEGSEFDILFNAPPDTFKKIRSIVMEVHCGEKEGYSLESVRQCIEGHGYAIRTRGLASDVYLLWATRPHAG